MSSEIQSSGPGKVTYEFDEQQNDILKKLAASMRWVALPLTVLGVIYFLATIVYIVEGFVSHRAAFFAALYVGIFALIALSLSRWTRQAARSFDSVISTDGQDIEHLMQALDNLRKKYTLLGFFVKVYVVILLIMLLVPIVALVAFGVQNALG